MSTLIIIPCTTFWSLSLLALQNVKCKKEKWFRKPGAGQEFKMPLHWCVCVRPLVRVITVKPEPWKILPPRAENSTKKKIRRVNIGAHDWQFFLKPRCCTPCVASALQANVFKLVHTASSWWAAISDSCKGCKFLHLCGYTSMWMTVSASRRYSSCRSIKDFKQ